MADNISVDVSTVDLTEGKTADAVVSNISAATATGITLSALPSGMTVSEGGAGGPFTPTIAPFDLDAAVASDFDLYYPIEGNADDESGNGYDGSVTNSTLTTNRLSESNRSYHHPSDGYIDCNFGIMSSVNWSISLWYKFDSASSSSDTRVLFAQYSDVGSPNGRTLITVDPSSTLLKFFMGSSAGSFNQTIQATIDTNIHHLVCTVSSSYTLNMYLDGVSLGGSWTLPNPVYTANTIIGNAYFSADPYSWGMVGNIEQIRGYHKTLSGADALAIYNAELSSDPSFAAETKTLTFRHDSDTTTLSIPSQMTISGTNDVDIYAEVEPANSFGNVNKGTCSSVYTLKVENIDSISRDVTGITAPSGFECKKSTDSTWSSSISSFTITSGSYENIDFRACTPEIGDVSGEATLSYNPTLSILLSVTSIASDFACTLITTHVDDAKDRLIRQYKQGSNAEDVAGALVTPIQQSENDLYELYSLDDIDVMVGTQLDMIGATIGQDRQGFLDDDYRILLKARIAINSSRGTLDDLLSIWNILNPSQTTEILEQFPAQIELKTTLTWATVQQADMAFEAMEQAVAAGVRVLAIYPIIEEGDGYLLLDSTDPADFLDSGKLVTSLNS